ncbi:MAG: MBG domain-containing protein, partial [Algoriphagus aquaeductus]|uniref:MBG domain-containing protein n=1 Tax=Algoriphagus aquaeductus TaxID=475299 RepID=UPI00391CB2AC
YSRASGETVLGGPYEISAVLSPSEVLSNYDITYNTGEFTITTKAASVTPDDNTKEYGSADPTLTGTLSGFLAGDNVTAVYSRASGETVLGGPYEISAVLSPSEVLSNYDITYNTGEFTIIPREATITADNRIKTYGETVVFAGTEFTTSGLLNSDAVSSVTLTSAGAAATATVSGSPYAIVASDAVGSGLDNYTIRYEDGELTITPRPITVTADDKIIFCGQAEPTLTYQITSGTLVNGDAFSGTLVRQTGNGAGTYVISKGSLTLVDNYELTVVNGIFTINAISVNAQGSFVNIQINSSGVLSATVSPAEAGIPVTFTFYRDGILTPYETKTGTTNTNGVATVDWTAPNAIEVFRVEVMAGSDACDAKEEAYVTVFDPSASFVTGGGWINSPAGSMRANPTAVGKANFGFVSKYKKGKNNTFTNEVDGNTEFQFQAGDLNFKSTMHESGSLVISGSRATYRGTGTVNGASGFRFVVVAIDGQWNGQSNPDRFRIKITTTNGTVIYDNGLGADENGNDATILGNNGTGGGSIVIHEVKAPAKGNKRVSTELMTVAWNTPVETIKKQVDQLSLTWFESRKLPMTLDASNYDPLTPGFYELKVDLMDNEFFALDEPISIQVLVQDKPKALDILVDNSKLTKELRVGDVLGILRTIDPVDNIHTYGIGDHPDLTLDGDKLIWKGTTVPAQLKLTVFSTDRAGQTISREISLSREMKPGEFFLYPNPAQRETNVMVDLDQEASVAIRIYDAVGRMVVENEAYREGSFTQTFNLDGLAAGFYTVQVKVGDMVMTKRLIKK